jgi:hypothetical protein
MVRINPSFYAFLPVSYVRNKGTHPELLQLQAELGRRRDGRLELADRRRAFEVANAYKKRKANDDAVWTWWIVRLNAHVILLFTNLNLQNSRDEAQQDLLAETNRKRRKLERDRRNAERPQPGTCHSVVCNTFSSDTHIL